MDTTPQDIIRREFRSLIPADFGGDIDNTPLYELGVDSLDFVEKLLYLEEEHNIVIPIERLSNDVCLQSIFTLLADG